MRRVSCTKKRNHSIVIPSKSVFISWATFVAFVFYFLRNLFWLNFLKCAGQEGLNLLDSTTNTTEILMTVNLFFLTINPFSANIPLLYPLEIEGRRLSDVFRGYRSRTLVKNELIQPRLYGSEADCPHH